jgi:hypothetical protein
LVKSPGVVFRGWRVILWSGSGAERLEFACHLRVGGGGREGDAGPGQDVEAEVAAAFGPFVVLFGQDGSDEADQGIAAGEDPDDIGPAAYFPVQALL